MANLWEGGENILDDYLFTMWNGNPAHPDTMTKWLYKFTVAHKLPKVIPHSFRHMTATFLIAAGTDITTVAGKIVQQRRRYTRIYCKKQSNNGCDIVKKYC